jgi:hypothetical protein
MEAQLLTPELPKKEKVRSAWISFAGRIVAQLIGAAATVGLGVVVFGHRQPAQAAVPMPGIVQGVDPHSVLVAKPVRTKEGTVFVFVPLDRYADVTDQMVEDVSVMWAKANAH